MISTNLLPEHLPDTLKEFLKFLHEPILLKNP